MTTAKLNIWIRAADCSLLKNCWRTDLAIQLCNGAWLVDQYPEVEAQLKERYAEPAEVEDVTDYSGFTDQGGQTIDITVSGATMESLTLTTPASTPEQICAQMQAYFQNVEVELVEGQIKVASKDKGPSVTLTVGGTAALVWGPPRAGSGYRISIPTGYYMGARRIQIIPPAGTDLNHVEVDVPPGCYKIWTRCCFGANEETNTVMSQVACGDHACINLLLPTLQTCSAGVMHPLMDQIVHNGYLANDAERVIGFRAVMHGAGIYKQEVLNQLDIRLAEAEDLGNPDLINRVNAVIALAQQLPEGCC